MEGFGRPVWTLSDHPVGNPHLRPEGIRAFVWTGRADPAGIAVALGFSVVASGTSLAICSTVSHAVWGEREPVGRAELRRLPVPPIPVGDRPLWAVGTTAVRRSIRAPWTLVFLVLPAVLFVEPIARVAGSGTLQPTDPGLVLLYGTWIAGGSYTLDLLGSKGPVLPVTLTTGVRGEALIDGRDVAGALIAGPPTLACCLLAGLLSPLSALETAVVTTAAVVTCPAAPYLAAAAGVAFPGPSRGESSGERTVTTPSKPAFVLFSMATALVVTPILGALAANAIPAVPAGALACAMAICAAAVARRSATWRIKRYRP